MARHVAEDLERKMVFLGGPRQSGKTTLARGLLQRGDVYLNWDDDQHRQQVLARRWTDDARLVVFDELHKFPRWKN